MKKTFFWAILTLIFAIQGGQAQIHAQESIQQLLARSDGYHAANPIEKLYLHPDKYAYTVGETIWFKAYAVVGVENMLSGISNIAYVELIDPKEQVVSSIKIPILNGIGMGDFSLIDTLIEGTYRLRAYTNWMRNDSADYFFTENIQISNGRADNVLTHSTLTEEGEYAIDLQNLRGVGLGDESVEYEISKNGKRLRRGRTKTNAMGRMTIPFRGNYEGAKLSLLFANQERSLVEKIFKLPNAPAGAENSVQFFPEGGNLLVGATNKIAAKSLRPDGLGISSRTEIVSRGGDTVAVLETNPLGMGSVPLNIDHADSLTAYTTFEDGTNLVSPLPLPIVSGYSLEINNMNNRLLFAKLNISSDRRMGQDVYFVVHHLGKVYYASKQSASKDALIFSVNKNELPNGVLTLSFMDDQLNPLMERPVFIYDHTKSLPLIVEADAATYATRQKVTISIESGTESDSVRNAALSASVINTTKIEHKPQDTPGILSSLLLSNDIRGYIESPGYYFEDGGIKAQAIDDLLLTQGWRKIDLATVSDIVAPTFSPEKGITIKGQARRLHRKAPAQNATLSLIPTYDYMSLIETVADDEGYFKFENLFFPDSINFIITAKDRRGRNRIDIVLERETMPAIGLNRNAPGEQNNVNTAFIEDILNSKRYFSELESRGFLNRAITIREVVVTGQQSQASKAADDSSNLNGPGNADQVISADDLSNCSSLESCLAGRILGVSFRNGIPYNSRTNGEMQIVLDGMYMESDELSLINPGDIESIEVLRNVAYTAVYGSYGGHGLLIITSKSGANALSRPYTPKGIATTQPRGLHINRTFYKPIYEPGQEVLFDRDLRTTIHWEPNIITDSSGKATFDFYTADEPGTYLITIEGLDLNGRPGRTTFPVEVR